jgi:hypothetical protein
MKREPKRAERSTGWTERVQSRTDSNDDYETPDGYRLFGQTTYVGDLSSRVEDSQPEPRVSSTNDLDSEGGITVEDGGNAYAFTYIVDFAVEMVDAEVQSCAISYTLNDRSITDEDCSGFTGLQPEVGF